MFWAQVIEEPASCERKTIFWRKFSHWLNLELTFCYPLFKPGNNNFDKMLTSLFHLCILTVLSRKHHGTRITKLNITIVTDRINQDNKISLHNGVIMRAMASQITCLTIVYSTVYSRRRSKKTSKLRVTGLCEGNSPVTGEFPAQRASNAENVSIWWRHHV